MNNKVVSIVGFGRFGKVLHRLFEDGFDILVSSSSYKPGDVEGVNFVSLEEACSRADAIILSVPINKTGPMGVRIKPFLKPGQIVVDVCSVKEYPCNALKVALDQSGVTIWPTHPMFGPDSAKEGFEGLNWVSCEEDLDPSFIEPYLSYLEQKGLTIVKTTCEEHDRLAATTQGLTHFIGRFLDDLDIAPTQIDTVGYKRLLAVKEQTCNDTWELFCDLQHYNRFSLEMQKSLADAIFKVSSRFLDDTVVSNVARVAIIDGIGPDKNRAKQLLLEVSELAAPELKNKTTQICEMESPMDLLFALSRGEIDYGLLRLSDTTKGPFVPVVQAMGRHGYKPVAFFQYEESSQKESKCPNTVSVVLVRRRKWATT